MQETPPVEVHIETRIRPTEDPEAVERAVLNLFPDANVERQERRLVATTDSIAMMLRKTGEERVKDAARGALWRGRIDDGSTRFELAKQAAAAGRINFNEVTHPLGDLVVTIRTRSLEDLLDAIAPPTRAEIAHLERAQETNARRAAMHDEERNLAAIGSRIDSGWDELDENAEGTQGLDEEA